MSNFLSVLANNTIAMKTLNYLSQIPKLRVPYADDNPFLKGPFAPVKDEISTQNLKVNGVIPPNLDGDRKSVV